MIKKILLIITSTLLLSLIISCDTSIDNIIEDYNSNFTPDPDMIKTSGPSPGEDDFTEDVMLENEYFIWDDSIFILAAPEFCVEYSWIITDPDDSTNTPVPVHQYGEPETLFHQIWKGRDFCINIIDSGLITNKVYKLTLKAISKEGHVYQDTAALVVYKHLIL